MKLILYGNTMWASPYVFSCYVEDNFAQGPRLLPAEPRARARARQVMAWIRSDLAALRADRSSQYVFFQLESLPPPPPLTEAGARAANQLVEAAGQLISTGPLFGTWSIADAELALMLQRQAPA